MALKITIKSKKGIDVAYWRIDGKSIEINERRKFIIVSLYGFVGKEHLVDLDGNDLEPIEIKAIRLTGDNFVKPEDRVAVKDVRDLVYKAIKDMTNGKDSDGNLISGEFAKATKI